MPKIGAFEKYSDAYDGMRFKDALRINQLIYSEVFERYTYEKDKYAKHLMSAELKRLISDGQFLSNILTFRPDFWGAN